MEGAPPMPPFLDQISDMALWLTALVAGLGALGWLARKVWRGYRNLDAFLRKAEVVITLASYELQHNGGGSIKDAAMAMPAIRQELSALRVDVGGLTSDVGAAKEQLAAHVVQANEIHDEQAQAIAHLAEALPIVARSQPHDDDAID